MSTPGQTGRAGEAVTTNGHARLCRCPHPERQVDGDGVGYCAWCGGLWPEASDIALPLLLKHVAALERRVEDLHRELIGGPR
jgi:hypothetical protein